MSAFGAAMDIGVGACEGMSPTDSICSRSTTNSDATNEWLEPCAPQQDGHDSATDTEGEAEADRFPHLLSRDRLAPAVPFRVKNTFVSVHVDAEEEDDGDLGAMPMVRSKTWSGSARLQTTAALESEDEAADGVVPIDLREPEESVGSSLHASRQCKPCSWYWRPQGCNYGEECRHCHMCPSGMLKARKKQKRTLRKAAAEQRGSASFLVGPMALPANTIVFAVPATAFAMGVPITSSCGAFAMQQ